MPPAGSEGGEVPLPGSGRRRHLYRWPQRRRSLPFGLPLPPPLPPVLEFLPPCPDIPDHRPPHSSSSGGQNPPPAPRRQPLQLQMQQAPARAPHRNPPPAPAPPARLLCPQPPPHAVPMLCLRLAHMILPRWSQIPGRPDPGPARCFWLPLPAEPIFFLATPPGARPIAAGNLDLLVAASTNGGSRGQSPLAAGTRGNDTAPAHPGPITRTAVGWSHPPNPRTSRATAPDDRCRPVPPVAATTLARRVDALVEAPGADAATREIHQG